MKRNRVGLAVALAGIAAAAAVGFHHLYMAGVAVDEREVLLASGMNGTGEGSGSEWAFVKAVPSSTNFGSVYESAEFPWDLIVENLSSEEVRLSDISGSCDCIRIQPNRMTLSPYEQGKIGLVIDLRSRKKRNDGSSWKTKLSVIAKAATSDARGTERVGLVAWEIEGMVSPVASLEPSHFSERFVIGETPAPRTVTLKSHIPGTRFYIKQCPDRWSAELRKAEGQTFLVVQPYVEAPGRFSKEIVLGMSSRESSQLPDQRILFYGEVEDVVRIDPPTAVLGFVPVGGEGDATLTVRSVNHRPFQITSVDAPEKVDVKVITGKDGSTTIRVNRKVERLGHGQDQIVVHLRVGDGVRKIAVPCEWIGTQAQPEM